MRYYKQPQQQIIPMDSPMNVEFYVGMLNRAQQNLDQSSAIQAKFLEDIYSQQYIDKKARDLAVGNVEQKIANVLDSDFVSPTKTAKTISKAAKDFNQWRNLNQKQLELAKNYSEDQRRLGLNFYGTDPTKKSLLNEYGELINPEDLNYVSMNTKDIYENFSNIYGANLLNTVEKQVKSDIPFKRKLEKITGLDEETKLKLLSPGSKDAVELANHMLETNPALKEKMIAINGNYNNALRALQEFNLKAAFDDKYRQTKDSQYINDDMAEFYAKLAATNGTKNPTSSYPFDTVPAGITPVQNTSVGQVLKNMSNSQIEIDYDNMPFNSQGNLMAVKSGTKGEGYETPYGTAWRSKTNPKVNESYKEAVTQLFNYKQQLKKQGIEVSSDKDAINKLKESLVNSAKFYSLGNDIIKDNFKGSNFNPFQDESGNYKDTKQAELEMFDEKSGKWIGTTYSDLAEKTGWDDKKVSTQDKNLRNQLANLTDREIDYWGDKPKGKGSIVTPKGEPVSIRFRLGNSKAEEYSIPYQQAQKAIITPGESTIRLGSINIKVKSFPVMINNGSNQVINRLSVVDIGGSGINNPAYSQMIEELKNTPYVEEALLRYTRNYRDNNYKNENIVYLNESTKK